MQWPFGFGLSFTTFAYSGLRVTTPTVAACDVISVTVSVSNTGNMDSDEVVQVGAKRMSQLSWVSSTV